MEQHQADVRHQKLTEKSILITVDEQEIFNENASMLQNHPAMREKIYQNMLESLAKGKVKEEALGKAMEKARSRGTVRAQEAKAPLHSEYWKKARQYMKEGMSREELAARVPASAKKYKYRKGRRGKTSFMAKSIKHKLSKMSKYILKKKSKQSKKVMKKKKKASLEEEVEFDAGPMVGKKVRVVKEQTQKDQHPLKNLGGYNCHPPSCSL